MGAEPWYYFVPYESNIEAALEKLKKREFEAGRFRKSELKPADMVQAFVNTGADGTALILDMLSVGATRDFCTVAPLSREELVQHFGTEQPTREMVMRSSDVFETIDRGQGVYVVCFRNGMPEEIFFGGCSFD